VALAPGEEVSLLALDLPPGLSGTARERVARRRLADLFGGALEGVEMRPAGRGAFRRVLVAESAALDRWRAETAPAGPRCLAILPDYLALPAAEGVWTVETRPGRVLARLGPEDGFAAEPALARRLLAAARAAGPAPRAVLRLGPAEPEIDGWLEETGWPRHDSAAAIPAPAPESFGHDELSMDLARDPAAAKAEMRRALRPWRLPAGLAALGFALWAGSVALETRALRAELAERRAAADRVAREVFIPSGPILDIRAQVARALEDQRARLDARAGEARPLAAFRAAAAVLAEGGARLRRAAYSPGGGLVVDLEIDDFAGLDRLVEALRAAGLEARVAQSTAREEAAVEATLALGAAGG
jgi:general secretion pathway protein L